MLEADFRPREPVRSTLASSVGAAHAAGAAGRSGSRASARRERRRASPPGVGWPRRVPVGHTGRAADGQKGWGATRPSLSWNTTWPCRRCRREHDGL